MLLGQYNLQNDPFLLRKKRKLAVEIAKIDGAE
jgi:hypothetical protein